MTSVPDTLPSFSALLRAALGDRVDPSATTFVEMFADDGIMEFPYAPPGIATALHGRAAVAAHLRMLSGLLAIDAFTTPVVRRVDDGETVVLEVECRGRGLQTGEPYEQRYISVITVRDGHIRHYRDYWNPLVVLRAIGGADATGARHD